MPPGGRKAEPGPRWSLPHARGGMSSWRRECVLLQPCVGQGVGDGMGASPGGGSEVTPTHPRQDRPWAMMWPLECRPGWRPALRRGPGACPWEVGGVCIGGWGCGQAGCLCSSYCGQELWEALGGAGVHHPEGAGAGLEAGGTEWGTHVGRQGVVGPRAGTSGHRAPVSVSVLRDADSVCEIYRIHGVPAYSMCYRCLGSYLLSLFCELT